MSKRPDEQRIAPAKPLLGSMLLLISAALCATCCLLVAPLMDEFGPNETGALFVYASFGGIVAAAGLVSVWSVFGAGRPAVRIGSGAAATAALYSLWTVGFLAAGGGRWEWASAALCLPGVFCATLLPLLAVRFLLRWDLEKTRRATSSNVPHAITIRGMMIATGLVGLSMAGVRLAWQEADRSYVDTLQAMGIIALVFAGANLVGTLPMLAVVLRARRLSRAMLEVGLYGSICLVLAVEGVKFFSSSRIPTFALVGLSMILTSFTVLMVVSFLGARLMGVRLKWGRRADLEEFKERGASARP